jgi:hyperosmotically inducible protein
MRVLTIIGCGAIAAACASNKPAEEPAHFSQNESSAVVQPTDTATSRTASDNRAMGSDYNASPGPSNRAATPPTNTTPGPRADGSASTPPLSAVRDPVPSSPPPAAAEGASRPDADNTRVNKRDQGGATLTPMDQGKGDADLKMTQQIRKAVMGDGSLSFTAKNVKIITANGKVTLRGPVKTDQEHQAIVDSARKIAGASNVDDQLEVKK